MNGTENIVFINIEYFFYQILVLGRYILSFFGNIEISAFIKVLVSVLCILLFGGISYLYIRVREIKEETKKKIATYKMTDPVEPPKNERWAFVISHSETENPSDWKLAIIEADKMLDDMVLSIGYKGESLGERLKTIEKSDFLTLDSAWEAHKIRNRIAHDGSDFVLTKKEVKRVVSLYEEVFKEFDYI